jgi:spore coat polysaccharide biosynthesis protein SpsF
MGDISIVLQARIGSTRLPRKLLLPLRGVSIFEHILRRLILAKVPERVIVATTDNSAPLIQEIADKYGIPLFIGSEDNVLARFVDTIHSFDIRTVVRATADNPLVSIDYIDRALLLHSEQGAAITSYPQLPYGTGIEVIESEVLEKVHSITKDPFEREHITQYIYRHEQEFAIVRGIPEKKFKRPDINLTVDTIEDYRNMCDIYNALYKGKPIPLEDVIAYLDSR